MNTRPLFCVSKGLSRVLPTRYDMKKAFETIQKDLEKSFLTITKSIYNEPHTYSGSWPTHVTRKQAEHQVRAHGNPDEEEAGESHWNSFLREVGDKPTYHKDKVLGWLGY